ncbi:MAG: hypothetical protein ACTSXC_05800 [Candidatus Freyarchaeota archaeon]
MLIILNNVNDWLGHPSSLSLINIWKTISFEGFKPDKAKTAVESMLTWS